VSESDDGVVVRGVDLSESGVDIEVAIVAASASGAVPDPICVHVFVVNLQLCRVSAAPNESGQRAATEIQVEIVVAQANIQLGIPACSENGSRWAMKQISEECVRQTPLEASAHSPSSVVASI